MRNCRSKVLIEDTRNKVNKHLNIYSYCKKNQIPIIRRKLDYGDYILEGNDNLTVDTKCSLLEVAMDLSGKGEIRRFYRQCYRALENKVKLIILIEAEPIYKTIEDIKYWVNPNYSRSKYCMSGQQLLRAIKKVQAIFKVRFELSDHYDMGRRLIELLDNAM